MLWSQPRTCKFYVMSIIISVFCPSNHQHCYLRHKNLGWNWGTNWTGFWTKARQQWQGWCLCVWLYSNFSVKKMSFKFSSQIRTHAPWMQSQTLSTTLPELQKILGLFIPLWRYQGFIMSCTAVIIWDYPRIPSSFWCHARLSL